jgi:hypothetical protein
MELTTINNLPTIQELFKNPELQLQREALNHYLNQPPPQSWVKLHPFIRGYNYLPIDKVEFLLRKFFKSYKIEVISQGVLFNAIQCQVRVHYIDPITNDWLFHDGVGAEELQTSSGSGSLKLDMSNINKGAVKMALPLAKTVAIKDACDHFGNVFGANLNRKDTIGFTVDAKLSELVLTKEEERLSKLIEKAKDINTLTTLKDHLTNKLQEQFDIKWKQIEQNK